MVVYEELIHVGEAVDENMIATKHACLYKNYVQKVVLAKMSEQWVLSEGMWRCIGGDRSWVFARTRNSFQTEEMASKKARLWKNMGYLIGVGHIA